MEKKISEFATIKLRFTEDLKKKASGISNRDKLQVCINLDIALATFTRYTSGNAVDVRRLELAESLLAEIKKVKEDAPTYEDITS